MGNTSNCCDVEFNEDYGICPKCLEHCEAMENEDD